MMAPVRVARSMMNRGLKRSLQYHSASARTSRPSASVLSTSMVWPDIEVTMSLGRWAEPEGMFSTSPMMPTASTLALRPARAFISPTTVPAPLMSHFMSSMPAEGFSEMPPVSKVTPLPTKATGALAFLPAFPVTPCQRMTTSRGSRSLPWATPSNAPMPRRCICRAPRISTFTPSLVRPFARWAMVSG